MEHRQISTNHSEYKFNDTLIVFSYGKAIIAQCRGNFVINGEYWMASSTTSKHVNYSVPVIKQIKDVRNHPAVKFCTDCKEFNFAVGSMILSDMSVGGAK